MQSKAKGWSVSAWAASALLAAGLCLPAWADGGVTYTDISSGGANGLVFERAGSPNRQAILREIESRSPVERTQFLNIDRLNSPTKPGGAGGVATFDYDNDGDFDLYVTNGPGAPNALFKNLWQETGTLTFTNVAEAAGVTALEQDSTGVCYGDLDNDGWDDLYVVATAMPARLFKNNGDGTFSDLSVGSGTQGHNRHSSGCSMGDVNNDGRLDIVVGNTYNSWNHRIPIFRAGATFPEFEHNELYVNQDDFQFTEEAEASGLYFNTNLDAPGLSGGSFTWAIAMVDLDLDGDSDILCADDQGAPAGNFSEERGWNRFHTNDGDQFFSDPTLTNGLAVEGSWMGLSFGDYDCNGYLDFFSTDLGDYVRPGAYSRWFLHNPDGSWSDPGLGTAGARDGFGWGTVSFDYDNDGDTDIVYYGGVDFLTSQIASNPGTVFRNTGNCTAQFVYDPVLEGRHQFRAVNAVSAGDLNRDGFVDLVTLAESTIEPTPIFQFYVPNIRPPTGSPFDPAAGFEPYWIPGATAFTFAGTMSDPGDFMVELNSGGNGNKWVSFWPVGTAGIAPAQQGNFHIPQVNRSGIGAVFQFTPKNGKTSMSPVDGGSSYASQSSREKLFGLGGESRGDLEVLWPGGWRSKIYNVRAGERLPVPALPCSVEDPPWRIGRYTACVTRVLSHYQNEGVIDTSQRFRYFFDALRFWFEEH